MADPALPVASRRLRSTTTQAHETAESRQDLLSADVTPTDLGIHLHALATLAEQVIPRVDDPPAALRWPERRARLTLLSQDAARLAPDAKTISPTLPQGRSAASVWGWLYVLEGSTMGGAVLERHLATLPAFVGVQRTSLTGYGERTGAMWHEFRALVDECADDVDEMCDAAVAAFELVDSVLVAATTSLLVEDVA